MYDEMKKAVDAFIKAWTPDAGVISPFASSSSQHTEPNDNHLEHYVKTFPEEQSPSVSSMFRSDMFSEGGENVTTEKTFDIGESATTDNSYTPSTSTEPDPLSANAMQKSIGTVDNGSEPAAGDTAEPVEKADDKCPHCGQAMPVAKSDDSDADDLEKKIEIEIEEEDEEEEDDAVGEDMKKSFWGGKFSPLA